MEENLDKCLEEINQLPNVIGVMYADRQGLCLGAKGHASNESAGIITAIADQAAKLEPNSKPPVVLLESETKQCFIQKADSVTAAIYKTIVTS
ncbi:ragulator complex protein LAMTOR5 [Hetaerina americana]|uniref:ragulator complex protein LAMTOR5 n=1 Tax=Hetaerina americana TaxID=62018 RepID=UPI003A7F1872